MRITIVGRAVLAGVAAGALLLSSAGACGPTTPQPGTVQQDDDGDDGDDNQNNGNRGDDDNDQNDDQDDDD